MDTKKHKLRDNITVDNLFPSSSNTSGTRGKKLDINSLFSGTPLNNDPIITFTSDLLIDKIKKRRHQKIIYYKQFLKYCHERIFSANDDQETDMIFTVIDHIPECLDYKSLECLEYIADNLNAQLIDTSIISCTSIFISWKYIELKKENKEKKERKR